MTIGGPLLGIFGTFIGSPSCLKLQSSFNETSVVLNYPLTIIAMLIFSSDPFYVALVILLIFNKIAISYFGAKVRQHWLNPGFSKNHEKIQDRFRSLVQARSEAKAGIKPGMSAQERAMSLVNSALPSPLGVKGDSKGLLRERSLGESDEEEDLDAEDDTSFGIIPKSRISEDARQSLTQF